MRHSIILGTCALFAVACDRKLEPVDIGSAQAAPQHADAKALRFTGVAHPKLSYTHRWTSSNNMGRSPRAGVEHQMTVVAVTGPDWAPGDAIPIWITEPSDIKDADAYVAKAVAALDAGAISGKVMDVAGREPGFRTESGWQKAIKGLEAESGEKSDPSAPIVMWPMPD